MRYVERPIFDPNVKIRHTNKNELTGYYTASCVNGGMFEEYYKYMGADQMRFFSWINSNALGCTFSEPGKVDFLIFRNIMNNDYKGISEYYQERHAVKVGFLFKM